MMKKHHRGKTAGARRQAVAASFLVSTAAGILSVSAHAEPAPTTQPPAMALTQGSGAGDSPAAPKVLPFVTAPTLPKAAPAAAPTPGVAGSVTVPTTVTGAGVPSALSAPAPGQADDLVWILDSNTRPWPLAYNPLVPLNAMYATLPTERDARIMLPGAIADTTDRLRFLISRYVTDNIGIAAQARGRQLESFTLWAENISKQKLQLPKNSPWAAYQFSKEAHATADDFKAKIQAQTEPQLRQVGQDVKTLIDQVSPLMKVMATYEQQMKWYAVLVQLKEGIDLYQSRVTQSDQQILDAIAAFERDNPPVARPEGTAPRQPANVAAAAFGESNPAANVAMAPVVARAPAEQPAVKKQEQPSSMGAAIVLMAVGAAIIGFFLKLRKRVSSKAPKKDGAAE